MFKIEHNIPLAKSCRTGISDTLRALGIGDSFVYSANKRNGLYTMAKQVGIKIITIKEDNEHIRVVRVS